MAAHDDLMLVITTLLGAMENMVDCKKEIRSLAEEVKTVTADIKSMSKEIKDIKKKVAVIEERVSHDKLPSKTVEMDLKDEITRKLEPVDKIPKLEKKLSSIIASINSFRRLHDASGGVVFSNHPLIDNEAFTIKIDKTNDIKADGGISLGVAVDKKEAQKLAYPLLAEGSLGIWSSKKCVEGKCHTYRDGERENSNKYDFDTRDLPVGTILGVKRWSNGDVSFLINGVDKGVAFRNVPVGVFAFVEGNEYIAKSSILS